MAQTNRDQAFVQARAEAKARDEVLTTFVEARATANAAEARIKTYQMIPDWETIDAVVSLVGKAKEEIAAFRRIDAEATAATRARIRFRVVASPAIVKTSKREQLDWEVLPPGWWQDSAFVEGIRVSGGRRLTRVEVERLNKLASLNSIVSYEGKSLGKRYYICVRIRTSRSCGVLVVWERNLLLRTQGLARRICVNKARSADCRRPSRGSQR